MNFEKMFGYSKRDFHTLCEVYKVRLANGFLHFSRFPSNTLEKNFTKLE